jgi:hypothetical protein
MIGPHAKFYHLLFDVPMRNGWDEYQWVQIKMTSIERSSLRTEHIDLYSVWAPQFT